MGWYINLLYQTITYNCIFCSSYCSVCAVSLSACLSVILCSIVVRFSGFGVISNVNLRGCVNLFPSVCEHRFLANNQQLLVMNETALQLVCTFPKEKFSLRILQIEMTPPMYLVEILCFTSLSLCNNNLLILVHFCLLMLLYLLVALMYMLLLLLNLRVGILLKQSA